MSDPDIPIVPTRAGTITAGIPPGTVRDEYTRTNINVGGSTDRPGRSQGGMGTGMVIAGILVVLGILALVSFNGSDNEIPTSSDVSIENNNAPVADPPPAPAADPAPAPAADPAPAPVADPAPAPDTADPAPIPTPDPPANP